MQWISKSATLFALVGATSAFAPGSASKNADRDRVQQLVAGSLHGDIELVSFGVASIAGDRGKPIEVLHVRETFFNRADNVPWSIELAVANVWLDGVTPTVTPIFVNSDAATLPVLIVAHGEHRIADLYFPIPEDRTDDALPYFALTYRVNTPDHRFEAHAMLGRATRSPTREQRAPEPGWGREWWSDPSYSWSAYSHRAGHVVPRVPTRIEIVRVPRAFYEELPAVSRSAEVADWTGSDDCDEW
jgi:hypothetical protein